jgi:hypothetical protein
MTFRSSLAALALLGLLAPLTAPARGAVESYLVNYRANADGPWLTYTTTRTLAQARSAVAELQALGYQAEYVTESVAEPVYSSGSYYYSPGYYSYHTDGYDYGRYHFHHDAWDRYHHNHFHHHHFVYHHHGGGHHYVYHHHDVHHHVHHHHAVHHHGGHRR